MSGMTLYLTENNITIYLLRKMLFFVFFSAVNSSRKKI